LHTRSDNILYFYCIPVMPSRKDITIYDIAKVLKLAPSTVSRGLRGHPAIRKDTIRRIRETAASMGYQQNPFASSLRKNSSSTIGVILPRLDSKFQSSVVSGIENVLSKHDYNLIISQSMESVEKEKVNVATMYNSRVDGLLVSLACSTRNIEHLDVFLNKGIPVVMFDRIMRHPSKAMTSIIIDNRKAGYHAVEHLIGQGCRRIMFVSDNLTCFVYSERYKGYKQALKDHGLTAARDWLFVTTLDEESGVRTVDRLLRLKTRPDAIFVANDTSAVATIVRLKQLGIAVPEEIAIVGFNNVPIARFVDPGLTTIAYPGGEMGEIAASTLIEILNSTEPAIARTIVLEHELIIRESSLQSGLRPESPSAPERAPAQS
jgi:LacI family transcriptional regulator